MHESKSKKIISSHIGSLSYLLWKLEWNDSLFTLKTIIIAIFVMS